MEDNQQAPRGARVENGKIRCLTARIGSSRNIGQAWWVSPGELQRELCKPRGQWRFVVDRKRADGDGDDLSAIANLTAVDSRELRIRGIFHYSQIIQPQGNDNIGLTSFFTVDRSEESRRSGAVRRFREMSAQYGTAAAIERMAAKPEEDYSQDLNDALVAIADGDYSSAEGDLVSRHLLDADLGALASPLSNAYTTVMGKKPGRLGAAKQAEKLIAAL